MSRTYTLKAEHMSEVIDAMGETLSELVENVDSLPPEQQDAVREYVNSHIKTYNERILFLKELFQWEEKEVVEDGDAGIC